MRESICSYPQVVQISIYEGSLRPFEAQAAAFHRQAADLSRVLILSVSVLEPLDACIDGDKERFWHLVKCVFEVLPFGLEGNLLANDPAIGPDMQIAAEMSDVAK